MILKLIARLVIFFGRWKITGGLYPGVDKAIIIVAPHTSNWDGLYGISVLISRGVPIKFLVKKELMFFPLGIFLKHFGAVAIDRKNIIKSGSIVNFAVDLFKSNSKIFLIMTPEGSRKQNGEWKRGFYKIAKEANVPIMTGYLDYSKREGGFGELFYLTDDEEKDIQKLKSFYKNMKGKNNPDLKNNISKSNKV